MGAHKAPEWRASVVLHAEKFPKSFTVMVHSFNRFRQDDFCGSVTIPCEEDMEPLEDKDFSLVKGGAITGTIRISLSQAKTMSKSTRTESTMSIGAEMDHVVSWLEEKPQLKSQRSLALADGPITSNDAKTSGPTLLSPKKSMLKDVGNGSRRESCRGRKGHRCAGASG